MAISNFDQIWEAVKGLDAEKQMRLQSLLDALLSRCGMPLSDEDEVELALLKSGTQNTLPPPLPD
jgi:hypothetical protein